MGVLMIVVVWSCVVMFVRVYRPIEVLVKVSVRFHRLVPLEIVTSAKVSDQR